MIFLLSQLLRGYRLIFSIRSISCIDRPRPQMETHLTMRKNLLRSPQIDSQLV